MAVNISSIEAIFSEALEIPTAEERAAYLDRACAADSELKRQVESLIAAHDRVGRFLASPTVSVEQGSPEPVGTTVGPYKLMEQIGEGGMGVVYVAEQTQPVRRRVAVKIIKPGMDTRQVIARFEAERQALAMMDHPNIAKVHDGGTTPTGRPYFVMELVRGLPITDYCDGEQLSIRDRLELFVLVCRAVQHAHQKGIIHRDLKPSNILVTLHDGVPVPKVIDFGVAKATGQSLTDKTVYTAFSQLVGTPLYMSPEQVELSGLDIDTRSDIYALGVLLYELLTGTTPFAAETFKQAAFDEMRRIIREEEPPKPSTRLSTLGETLTTVSARRKSDPRRLGHSMRGELDWVVMKALEKDRRRRYETANDFASDVSRYLTDQPVEACPPSAGYRLRKFVRRNKGPVTAGLALAGLLVLGTAGTSIGLVWALRAERTATQEKERATAAEAQAKEEAAVATAVRDFLTDDLLGQALPDKNAGEKSVTVKELLKRAADRIPGKFARHPRVEAEIRLAIGDSYAALGDFEAAQTHLGRAFGLGRSALGDEHPRTLEFYNHRIRVFEQAEGQTEGECKVAVTLTEELLETRRRVLGMEHPDTVTSMVDLGRMYVTQRQLARAERLLLKALDAGRRVLGPEDHRILSCMDYLIQVYDLMGKPARAEALRVASLGVRGGVQGRIEFMAMGVPDYTLYQVRDDGTGLKPLPFPQVSVNRVHATTRSDYPGGRQYLYVVANGDLAAGTLMVWSEATGQSKAVTSFQAPLSIFLSSNQWSNDGLDRFVSFFVYSSATQRMSLYRAHVSADDLASPSYLPVTLGDPRLEFLIEWPTNSYPFYWWNHDGSRFAYLDSRDTSKIRVKTIGVGITVDDDPIVFAAPVQLSELKVSPANDNHLVASALPIGTGILAIDLQTSTSWWLATYPTQNVAGLRGPCFSPDGSTVAFGNSRSVTTGTGKKKTTTVYYGVYKVPLLGGPITRVAEAKDWITGYTTVIGWHAPRPP